MLRTVSVDGDSRAQLCYKEGRTRSQGFMFWAIAACGGRIDFEPVPGHVLGGQSDDILGRVGDFSALSDRRIVGRIGTNDRTGTGQTGQFTIDNLDDWQNALLGYGHQVTYITEGPRGDSNGNAYSAGITAANVSRVHRVRNFQNRQPLLVEGVDAVDVAEATALDSSTIFAARSEMLRDGLHDGVKAAYITGKALGERFIQQYTPLNILPTSNSNLYDPTSSYNLFGNLLTNGMFLGNSGSIGTRCTGELASYWNCAAGVGVSGHFEKITINGEVAQRLTIAGTGPTTASVPADKDANPLPYSLGVIVQQSLDHTVMLNGDVIQIVGWFKLHSGHQNLRGIPLMIEYTTSAGVTTIVSGEGEVLNSGSQDNLDLPNTEDIEGVWKSVPIAIVGTVTAARVVLCPHGKEYGGTLAPISAILDFRAFMVNKVGI